MSSKLKVNNIIPSTGTQIGISTTGGGINLLTGTVVTGVVTATSFVGGLPITSGADNRVITASSASAIQGEANLTFDGSVADLTGKLRIDIATGGTVGSGNAEGIFLRNTQETDNNAVTIFGGADDYNAAASAINFVNVDHSANYGDISFDTRGSSGYGERLRIASNGEITQTAASGNTVITLKRSNTNTTGTVGGINFAALDGHSVASIQARGDGNDEGAHIQFYTTSAAAGDMYNAANIERLRITSAGKVGIGTINPSGSLGVWDASGSDPTMSLHHSNADVEGEIIRIGRTDIPTIRYHSIKARHGGAATANFIKFHLHNGSSTTSQSELLRLEGDGDVTIPDGDLVIGTAGHGIDFSATSDATGKSSELLDDYEEGQWTPIIQFSNGGNTATYTSNRGGWYVKVGRLVTCNGRIEISAKGSGSSAVYFGGLPFTVGNHNSGTSGIEGGLTFSYVGNVNADKGSGMIGGYASENTTQAVPFYVDTSNNFHYVEDFDLESDASVGFVITYAV